MTNSQFIAAKENPGKKFYTTTGHYIREGNEITHWYYTKDDDLDFIIFDIDGNVIHK